MPFDPADEGVLDGLGVRIDSLELLSPPTVGRKRQRTAWRGVDQAGQAIKVRRFASADEASGLEQHRRLAPAAYVPVRARSGAWLVEPWVDGDPLTAESAASHATALGQMLASLHAVPVGGCRVDTAPYSDRCRDDLARIRAHGDVQPDALDALADEVTATDPGTADLVLTHQDFCPENVVRDPRAQLWVVDNEWVSPAPAGVDLGRTFARWPMSACVAQSFLDGYHAVTAPVPALRYWTIVMAARSLAIRLEQPAPLHTAPRTHLLSLASVRG